MKKFASKKDVVAEGEYEETHITIINCNDSRPMFFHFHPVVTRWNSRFPAPSFLLERKRAG
jgi:hypothetical protein